MKNYIIILSILISIFGCRKIDIDKSKEQLEGRWELKAYEVDGKDELTAFRSDSLYFDYLICYPYPDTNLYIHTNSPEPLYGRWDILPNNFSYQAKMTLQLIPFSTPWRKSFFDNYYVGWSVTKINNNKLIIESETDNNQTSAKHIKLSFLKTGKF